MTSVTAHLEQILNRWVEAFDQYEALKLVAEAAVVRWEWAAGERYSALPFYFKRFPGRARLLKNPPESPGYYYRYGFDASDRLRVMRFYAYLDQNGTQRLERDRARSFIRDDIPETFYTYSHGLAEIIEYSIPARIPLRVQRITYHDERVVRHVFFKLNGYTPLYSQKRDDPLALYEWLGPKGRFKQVELYQYDGDRLSDIQQYTETPGLAPFESQERFSYDETGKLVKIERVFQGGTRRAIYQKRKKGQTFKSIREDATRKLIEAIVEKLRSAGINETVCCIELSYQGGLEHFPPVLLLGFESARRKMLASGDPNAHYYVFMPALMGQYHWLEIDDPEVLDICSQLEQEIHAAEKWETARRILGDIAAALTRQDWTGILETTSDFVVFAIDWEMDGPRLASILGEMVTKEQIHEWKQKGWL